MAAVQFNGPRRPNRGIVSDADADLLVAVAWAAVALPLWVAWRGWRYLRTGE